MVQRGKIFHYQESTKPPTTSTTARLLGSRINNNSDGSTPRVDEYNPNEAKQSVPLLELVILKGLEYNATEKQWQNGTIYDPENGKTYECFCELNDDGSLYFKGYVLGITWLGRSTTWTRP